MMSLRMCLIALAIIFVSIQTVSSLSCWVCDSGPKCEDTIKKNVTCIGGLDACLSIKTNNKKPVTLGCVDKKTFTPICDAGLLTHCKVCEKDNCNSSSFVMPSIFTITIFAALVTKMYF